MRPGSISKRDLWLTLPLGEHLHFQVRRTREEIGRERPVVNSGELRAVAHGEYQDSGPHRTDPEARDHTLQFKCETR